ncbi:hypothetical protein SteCoe_9366 [Stentor coeruleus]|uniref:Translin-associated factor X-interacting protein 1 N-terminal domain-containing protein n=1 Tax=Stentor coeruleus TaxID=5963 RepID=A0A1R2CI94_9CILI|nr:hypothetical protein SteCoe_9366 [Stentor coeruleus]
MSKAKKVPIKKLSEQKVSHYASLSLINPQPSIQNYNQVTDKPELYSESPYAQKLIKVRSTSIVKDPALYHNSGLVSPPLNTKFGMHLKNKISLSTSFVTKVKDASENQVKIKKKPMLGERKSLESQTYLIELKIDDICAKHKETGITNEILDKYREVLEEIIYKDKVFGSLLAKIKFAYEDWIKSKGDSINEITKYKTEILEFSRKLTEEIEENKRLHKKVQKFSRENVELGRALDERDNNCKALQDHLLKITNISIEEVPQDRTSWKVLIAENKSYSELCSKLKKKIKVFQLQEKKLMKLFWILKQKNYPVEEIYQSLNTKPNKSSNQNSVEEFSDFECLNSDPPKSKNKPSNVPTLKMNQVEPNSFSDDSAEESF